MSPYVWQQLGELSTLDWILIVAERLTPALAVIVLSVLVVAAVVRLAHRLRGPRGVPPGPA